MILLCSVCFGGADPIARDSLNAGIFVLMGVTALVLGCLALFFFHLAQRARTAGAQAEAADLVHEVLPQVGPASAYRR